MSLRAKKIEKAFIKGLKLLLSKLIPKKEVGEEQMRSSNIAT